jgi:integrase
MKTRYKNVTLDPDRHGKLRARFRKGSVSVYMATLPDQKGFEDELAALRAGYPVAAPNVIPGSVSDLLGRFYASADFRGSGSADSRKRRRGILESFRARVGDDLVTDFTFEHIEAILLDRTEKRRNDKGRIVGGEVAATNLREELDRLFRYARRLKWRGDNPVEDAAPVGKARLGGFYSWTEADIAQYQATHAIGTKPRLALEIMLWTGQRRGDASRFGPRHIVRGKINFQASKNGADLWLPVAPDLRRAIAAMAAIGLESFLVTEYGKPFSVAGLGNKMREWCDEAGLPKCTAHGLRKAIGRRSAQTEGTQQGIKAVGGWRGDAEVRTYTESVDQERLADATLGRVIDRFSQGNDGENG